MAGPLKVTINEPEPVKFSDMVPAGINSVAKMVIGEEELECNVLDLQQDGPHSELGRGAFGAVYRMKHKPTGTIMAVKKLAYSGSPSPSLFTHVNILHGFAKEGESGIDLHPPMASNDLHAYQLVLYYFLYCMDKVNMNFTHMIHVTMDKKLRRRMEMDLKVCMESKDCPHTITFYGALFGEGDVMICMELMDMSLHDLRILVFERLKQAIPEAVLGKIAESTLKALIYLKTKLNVLHRDVKPSNILINKQGEIKLCDFGIAGELVNSYVGTNIGCKPYLAPERINPVRMDDPYDQRSDVWSYGITISELALGRFPYPPWDTEFEMLALVVDGDAPRLNSESGFSTDFMDLVHQCLTKNVEQRPKFHSLADHRFIVQTEKENVDVAYWYKDILRKAKANNTFLPPHVIVD